MVGVEVVRQLPKYTIFFLLKITLFTAWLLYIARRLLELEGWALPGVLIVAVLFIFSCLPEFVDAAGRMLMRDGKRMNGPGKPMDIGRYNAEEKKGLNKENGNVVDDDQDGRDVPG